MSRYPINEVSPEELRRIFNEGRYYEKALAGEYRQDVKANNHPSKPKAREPFCTRSQIVAYYDRRGNEVARVHQYLRPDGTIGASGLPDPKRILRNLELYIVVEP